jgi:hypothetical protein
MLQTCAVLGRSYRTNHDEWGHNLCSPINIIIMSVKDTKFINGHAYLRIYICCCIAPQIYKCEVGRSCPCPSCRTSDPLSRTFPSTGSKLTQINPLFRAVCAVSIVADVSGSCDCPEKVIVMAYISSACDFPHAISFLEMPKREMISKMRC